MPPLTHKRDLSFLLNKCDWQLINKNKQQRIEWISRRFSSTAKVKVNRPSDLQAERRVKGYLERWTRDRMLVEDWKMG